MGGACGRRTRRTRRRGRSGATAAREAQPRGSAAPANPGEAQPKRNATPVKRNPGLRGAPKTMRHPSRAREQLRWLCHDEWAEEVAALAWLRDVQWTYKLLLEPFAALHDGLRTTMSEILRFLLL